MSIIRGNIYNDKLEIVKVTEFCKPEIVQKNLQMKKFTSFKLNLMTSWNLSIPEKIDMQ